MKFHALYRRHFSPSALFRDREPSCLPTTLAQRYNIARRASRPPPPPRIIRATYNPHFFNLPQIPCYVCTRTGYRVPHTETENESES